MSLYETLEVKKDATSKEIKDQYRKKSKTMHPDVGGDPKQFREIAVAYSILSDASKRERYDKGEDPDKIQASKQDKVLATTIQLFCGIIDQVNVDTTDVVAKMREILDASDRDFDGKIREQAKKIAKLQNAMARTLKKTGPNILSRVLENNIAALQEGIVGLQKDKAELQSVREFIKDYDYRFDAPMNSPFGSFYL